jgi:DNA-binding transcriptional MerR regulator
MSGLLTVGRFAAACRLSVKALHHYDDVGVLRPVSVDPATGYRYYAPDQVRTALTIALLRSLDVPLPVIKEVLREPAALAPALSRERERLRREALRARQALASVERILREGTLAPHEVASVVEPDRTVVALRGRATAETLLADSERLIGDLLARLAAAAIDASAAPVIGVYPDGLDGEFPIIVAVEETEAIPDAAGACPALERFALPGGAFATASHVGAYEELPLAYHALAVWLHEHGHPLAGPVREVYLNDPADTPPASLVTRVMVPIAET